MTRILFAATLALTLGYAAPAFAGPCGNCADCPEHKATVAAAEKKDEGKTACNCNKDTKGECKCGANSGCHCPHCHGAKESKKT